MAPSAAPFKACTTCNNAWETLAGFVLDPCVEVIGYLADPRAPANGLVLVEHRTQQCGTSLGVRARQLRRLYDGPRHTARHMGSETCKGYCLSRDRLEECVADCDLAWVRRVMQHLRRHELPPHLVVASAS